VALRVKSGDSAYSTWQLPAAPVELSEREVHIWQAGLDRSPSQTDSYLLTLSTDERARADRFYFRKDRESFIVARGVLRSILGRYLNRTPESLHFHYSSHGKPELEFDSGGDSIRFNLSHSHRMALYAIACDQELGIDIEHIRDGPHAEHIAEQFFSPNEVRVLRALPSAQQRYAFFLCWTRKEAYIKGRGEGLSLPLDQFDVSLTPGEPAKLLSTRPDPLEAERWLLQDLTLEQAGYAAAVAIAGGDRSTVFRRYIFPPDAQTS
jgi:4'-phosphopantetheinyl transferase